MTSKPLILLSASALALAGCGQKNDTPAVDANMTTQTNTDAMNGSAMAAPMTAQGFANAAATSDRFEVESSRLAATAGQSAAVKAFADKMISAHTDSTAKLKAAAAGMNPPMTPDDMLTPDQQQVLDSLKALNGANFDTAYAAAQVNAHQATLDALNAYAASGDNVTLVDLAKGMIPTVTAHLNMAKGLK